MNNDCVICKNNTDMEGIRCNENHFHCKDCFQTFVNFNSNSLATGEINNQNGTNGEIYCTMRTEANGENCCKACQFSSYQIAQCVDSETFSKYLEAIIYVSNNKLEKELLTKHSKDILELKTKSNSLEIERKNRQILQEQLQKEFPDALQCRRCGFGPIISTGCWDLETHHNHTFGYGRNTRINNSCPRCGWFTREKKEWQKWNGILPDSNNFQTNNYQTNNYQTNNNNRLVNEFMFYSVVFYLTSLIFDDINKNLPYSENNHVISFLYFVTISYLMKNYITFSLSKLEDRVRTCTSITIYILSYIEFVLRIYFMSSIYFDIYFYEDFLCKPTWYYNLSYTNCIKPNMFFQIYFLNKFNIITFIAKEILEYLCRICLIID